MALVTVTNTSGRTINVPAVGEDGISLGGGNHPAEATHRSDPLPYPFGHIGTLADAAAKQLPMQPSDFRYSRSQAIFNHGIENQWNLLVQAGIVTFAVAAQADNRDVEELFLGTI